MRFRTFEARATFIRLFFGNATKVVSEYRTQLWASHTSTGRHCAQKNSQDCLPRNARQHFAVSI